MPILPETAEHQLFRMEIWGDTAVIVPRGDAVGFTAQAVNSELTRIHEILRRDAVKHLIVDLGSANYFGSIVLGAVVQLGQVIQAKHGRIALAAASEDMQDVLRLMKLDTMWEFYPTEKSALRSMARIPLAQKMWARRRIAASFLILAAIILGFIYFPRINYGQRYYVEVNQLWREAQARRDLAGEEEWNRFMERSQKKLEPMLKHMLRRSDNGQSTQAELYLIYVIRDYWQKALRRSDAEANFDARLVQFYLRCAEADLEGRPIPAAFWNQPGGFKESTTKSE